MEIGNNCKFAAIAFSRSTSVLGSRTKVVEDLFFLPQLPFKVDSTWQEWLGTLRSDKILQANLVLFATAPSANPGVFDDENQKLQETVLKLLYSLLVLGVPSYGDMNVLHGANQDGHIAVRQVARMPTFYIGSGSSPYVVNDDVVAQTRKIFESMETIYSTPGKFIQLKRGLKAFQQALAEANDYDRLHQFVRSIDALLMTEKGKGKRQFKDRCRTFTLCDPELGQVLDSMYELRGRVEHLTDWDDLFPKATAQDRVSAANHRTRQAEALSRHVYKEILTSPILLNFFEGTQSIVGFWGLPADEKARVWSNKFALDSVGPVTLMP
jgi:hypothetical protein